MPWNFTTLARNPIMYNFLSSSLSARLLLPLLKMKIHVPSHMTACNRLWVRIVSYFGRFALLPIWTFLDIMTSFELTKYKLLFPYSTFPSPWQPPTITRNFLAWFIVPVISAWHAEEDEYWYHGKVYWHHQCSAIVWELVNEETYIEREMNISVDWW